MKAGQFPGALGVDQNALRTDVAMDDVAGVLQVGECLDDLDGGEKEKLVRLMRSCN